jgi:hypothetical protein
MCSRRDVLWRLAGREARISLSRRILANRLQVVAKLGSSRPRNLGTTFPLRVWTLDIRSSRIKETNEDATQTTEGCSHRHHTKSRNLNPFTIPCRCNKNISFSLHFPSTNSHGRPLEFISRKDTKFPFDHRCLPRVSHVCRCGAICVLLFDRGISFQFILGGVQCCCWTICLGR